jgi:hypothetical protein
VSTTRIPTYPDAVTYEAAWGSAPRQWSPPPLWTDITNRVLGPWSTVHGEQYQMTRTEAGTWRPVLDNRDGGLDPSNSAGPYYPLLAPYNPARIRLRFGPNQLTSDQATAGEQSGFLNAIPTRLNVVNDFGYPLSITTSGSAFQGTQVYQAVLPTGATQFGTVLLVKNVPVIPRQPYSFQAQCRITAGNSVSTQAVILWYDANGNSLSSSTVSGAAQTLTSGSGTWAQLSASTGAAPAGAYSAQLKLQIASGTLTGSTTWQVDGLQWEQSAYPTLWTAPGTLGANLLPQQVATGTAIIDPTKDSPGKYFACAAGTIAQAVNLTAAPNGATTAVAWTSPSGTTSSSPFYCGAVAPSASAVDGPVMDCTQVTAGSVYSASCYLMRTSSADATVQVQVGIRWFNSSGTVISASNGAATTVPVGSWVRASVANVTAPAGAVWGRARFFISTPASTTAQNTIYSTGWQLEQAAAVSAWADPGPTLFAWSGFFEQFPQSWRLSETWGQSEAVGTDVLAGLAQRTLKQPYIEELNALGARFIYELGDPAGSGSVADTTGTCPAGSVTGAPAGLGSLTLGVGINANSASGLFQGTTGPVATFANTPSGAASTAMTYIALNAGATVPNYGVPSTGPFTSFTRLIAFRVSTTPAAAMYLWSATGPAASPTTSQQISFFMDVSGHIQLELVGVGGNSTQAYTAQNYADGNWHLATIGVDASTGIATTSLDGVWNTVGGANLMPYGMTRDSIGGYVQDVNLYQGGANADIALAAQVPLSLTPTQITNLYNSWRSASAGESTGSRAARLFTWIGWGGPTAFDTGQTTSMGPANDLAGQSALDAFNAIITTENGDGYASNAGVPTFKSRAARYNSTPLFIFGEGPPRGNPGEWPAEDMRLPTDPLNTYNIIPTQQYSTGLTATAQDASSQNANWERTATTRVINSTSYPEVQAAGQYELGQLRTPRQRLASMTLNVSAVPGLWRVAAQLEKGVRIRAFKRPPGRSFAAPIQVDCFVERTEWTRAIDGTVTVRVEASPADTANYLVTAALHTTLNAQAAAGGNTAKINALADSAVNPLAASLPQGYQLRFEPGTPRDETLTLVSGGSSGIPATNPGYFTATLTFTGTFQFTHAAGTTVCEPLPAGFTDPTTWDGQVSLGAAAAPVLSGGASGTNTITVGPLADASANALGSTWNVGDLLWVGVGTGNFEGYNLCSPNQATAGEGVIPLPAGSSGASVGITADVGTPTVTASASAFQGGNVWQTACGASVSTPTGLLYLLKVPVTAGLNYTGSVYVRSVTTGANPVVTVYVKFLDGNGNSLAQSNSVNTTLTGSPTAGWTRIAATGLAPSGTVWVQMGVLLQTAPGVSWTFQADGLQVEQAGSASAFGVVPQIKSVAASAPGYSSVQLTMANNFAFSHNPGETVCDPLPAGSTGPPASPVRLAY